MKCGFKTCENLALSLSEFCWDHLPDKEDYKAKLVQAIKDGSDLSGYNLKKIVLKNVNLEKASLSKTNLSQADLSGTHLFDAQLEGADLVGTSLAGCELTHCNLKDTDLTKANLTNSRLWNADMRGANLTECDLSGADLWNADLFNTKLWHTGFMNSKFLTMRNFSDNKAIFGNAKTNETGYLSAEESYRELKRYFIENGMYNDASWAAFKEKTMERMILKNKKSLAYIPSLVMNVLCGYGEKPYRIVLSAIGSIIFFGFSYFVFNTMESASLPDYVLRWADYLYVSVITFTTVGYGDFVPKASSFCRLLAASEAFMGVFLTGLFIFTLARKYSAR